MPPLTPRRARLPLPHELTIRPAVNGGFTVRHSFENRNNGPAYQAATEHAFADHAAMMAHVHIATGGKKIAVTDADAFNPAARVRARRPPGARASVFGLPTRSQGGHRW
jgi:hypothetical protein